jgi:hypothetical protein
MRAELDLKALWVNQNHFVLFLFVYALIGVYLRPSAVTMLLESFFTAGKGGCTPINQKLSDLW